VLFLFFFGVFVVFFFFFFFGLGGFFCCWGGLLGGGVCWGFFGGGFFTAFMAMFDYRSGSVSPVHGSNSFLGPPACAELRSTVAVRCFPSIFSALFQLYDLLDPKKNLKLEVPTLLFPSTVFASRFGRQHPPLPHGPGPYAYHWRKPMDAYFRSRFAASPIAPLSAALPRDSIPTCIPRIAPVPPSASSPRGRPADYPLAVGNRGHNFHCSSCFSRYNFFLPKVSLCPYRRTLKEWRSGSRRPAISPRVFELFCLNSRHFRPCDYST